MLLFPPGFVLCAEIIQNVADRHRDQGRSGSMTGVLAKFSIPAVLATAEDTKLDIRDASRTVAKTLYDIGGDDLFTAIRLTSGQMATLLQACGAAPLR